MTEIPRRTLLPGELFVFKLLKPFAIFGHLLTSRITIRTALYFFALLDASVAEDWLILLVVGVELLVEVEADGVFFFIFSLEDCFGLATVLVLAEAGGLGFVIIVGSGAG